VQLSGTRLGKAVGQQKLDVGFLEGFTVVGAAVLENIDGKYVGNIVGAVVNIMYALTCGG